jgi:hypothetical protein
MEKGERRYRVLSVEEAGRTFALQLHLFPDLMSEFARLSGGSFGVAQAMMETIADEISYEAMEATTPERIRTIVGAPEDAEQLGEWRETFWDQYKAAQNLD